MAPTFTGGETKAGPKGAELDAYLTSLSLPLLPLVTPGPAPSPPGTNKPSSQDPWCLRK